MSRALRHFMILVASVALAGTSGASGAQTEQAQTSPTRDSSNHASAPAQQSPGETPLSGTPLPTLGAEEPRHLPSTEVLGYREARQKCDRARGTGREDCRAQLAAKYAEMDRLCRIVSTGTELPVCIRSAYAAD